MRTALLILTLVISAAAPARSDDLSRYCGHPVTSRNIVLLGQPLDARTCTANCFRFILTCNNGRKFNLASRYTPYDPDWVNWFTEVYPFPQLLVFGLVAFLAFVMYQGKAAKPALNAVYFGIVGLTMFFWPSGATQGPHAVGADLTMMGSAFAVIGFPVFVVLNIKALMRGWNYLFVPHPAAPIVETALQGGRAIDTQRLAKTLQAGARDEEAYPVYHYENQAEKARALKDKINVDAATAAAMARREEARAEFEAAERALAEAKRRGGATR